MKYIPPQPNPVVEQRVREQLQRVDPLLDIRWQPMWKFNPVAEALEGRYVLICYWPQSDRRWSAVQDQRIDAEPFDILGMFNSDPGDYASVPESPDQVMELVLERLASCDGEKLPHTVRMREVHESNMERRKTVRTDMNDEMIEAALEARAGVFKPATVPVGIELRS